MDCTELCWVFEKSSIPRCGHIHRYQYDATGNLRFYGIARRGSAVDDDAWIIEKYFYDDVTGKIKFTLLSEWDKKWTDRAVLEYK